jgi:hypothetical protein
VRRVNEVGVPPTHTKAHRYVYERYSTTTAHAHVYTPLPAPLQRRPQVPARPIPSQLWSKHAAQDDDSLAPFEETHQ